jgi:hypothetical protein
MLGRGGAAAHSAQLMVLICRDFRGFLSFPLVAPVSRFNSSPKASCAQEIRSL